MFYRYAIFVTCASLISLSACQYDDAEVESNAFAAPDGTVGGIHEKPLPCESPWEANGTVVSMGRVTPDGTTTGQQYPGSVNIASIELLGPTLRVAFASPLPDASYTVLMSAVSSGKIVTFVPTYVATNLHSEGFDIEVYNLKGEPISWNTPTMVGISFAVY